MDIDWDGISVSKSSLIQFVDGNNTPPPPPTITLTLNLNPHALTFNQSDLFSNNISHKLPSDAFAAVTFITYISYVSAKFRCIGLCSKIQGMRRYPCGNYYSLSYIYFCNYDFKYFKC